MQNLPNIEKSAFHRGEYVGYAAGTVWRIQRTNSSDGVWVAFARDKLQSHHGRVAAFRLADLSAKLEQII